MAFSGLHHGARSRGIQILVTFTITIAALAPAFVGSSSATTWEPSVLIAQGQTYGSLRMSTANNLYVVTWIYSTGPVYLYKSADDGATWSSAKNVFNNSIWWASPGVCSYSTGAQDTVLVACNPGYVAKSTDSGNTFTYLTNLPLNGNQLWWGYPQLGTNASWRGGVPDSDIYAIGSIYLGYEGLHAVAFTKSFNGGAGWITPKILCDTNYTTYWPQMVLNGQDIYVIYTRLKTDLTYEGIYSIKSSNWGYSWSSPIKVANSTGLGAFANSLQPLDQDRAMLVLVDQASYPAQVRMRYGYYQYATQKFTELGGEAGPQWNFTYCGVGAHLTEENEFQMAYIDGRVNGTVSMRYTHSHDTGLVRSVTNPRITSSPWTVARVGELYSYNASASAADNGTSTWTLATNAPWLSVEWSSETNCLLTGVPDSTGSYWAKLTVQDLNSSDSDNWTIAVLPPPEVHWAPPTIVSPASESYFGLDLGLGRDDMYALSWVRDSGPVRLFRSGDNGTSWSAGDIVPAPAPGADPGMCVYGNGSDDVILVASGPGKVLKSDDSGATFSNLADLPTSGVAASWRYLGIGTNASWSGEPPDDDIYVVGSRFFTWPTAMYAVSFTKSVDGGKTWKSPVTLAGLGFASGFPEMLSDGSRLYVVYTGVDGVHEDLYLRYSDDWGTTWSAQQVLLRKQTGSDSICPYSFQHLSSKRALLTLAEYGPDAGSSIGRCGYFDFSSLRFQEAWNVTGDEWLVSGGFAGRLKDNSNLTLAWLMETSYPQNQLVFTYALDAKVRADEPPVAMANVTPESGSIFTDFLFDASASWDFEDASGALQVRWDWEGDGVWDTNWSTEKTAHYTFVTAGNYSVVLEVRDSAGETANATILIEVADAEIPEFPTALIPVMSTLALMAAMSVLVSRRRRMDGPKG